MKPVLLINVFTLSSLLLVGCANKVTNNTTKANATTDNKKLSDNYVNSALEYLNHNALHVALDNANSAISANHDNARAYMVRGVIYQQLNESMNAESNFKQSLKLNNSSPYAHVNYANFLCSQKRYDEAFISFNSAINNPSYLNPEIGYYNRGKCYFQNNELDLANEDLLKSISYNHIPQDSYVLLAHINYDQYKYKEAELYIDKYTGTQSAVVLWLHIKILHSLIEITQDVNKKHEYVNNEKSLAKILLDDFPNSTEAKQYVELYGKTNSSVGINLDAKNNMSEGAVVSETSKDTNIDYIVYHDKYKHSYIVINSGQTLYSISNKFKISIAKLKHMNRLSSNEIKAGNKLYLNKE